MPCYKNSFIGKANNWFKIEHDKVNDIPFELELQNLGTTCERWEIYIHIDNPNNIVQGVYRYQYDDAEDDYWPLHSITSD